MIIADNDAAVVKQKMLAITKKYEFEKLTEQIYFAIAGETNEMLKRFVIENHVDIDPGEINVVVNQKDVNKIGVDFYPMSDRAEIWLVDLFKKMQELP